MNDDERVGRQQSKSSKLTKKPYEKPRVTTLGRVGNLTNGGGGSAHSDALSARSNINASSDRYKRD